MLIVCRFVKLCVVVLCLMAGSRSIDAMHLNEQTKFSSEITPDTIKNPETLCLTVAIFAKDKTPEALQVVTQDLKTVLESSGHSLAASKDHRGHTALHHAYWRQGRLKNIAPILLDACPHNQRFALLVAQDNAGTTVLHLAALNGLDKDLELFMKYADEYACNLPERKEEVLAWLGTHTLFGDCALKLAEKGSHVWGTQAYKNCAKILNDAEKRYGLEN